MATAVEAATGAVASMVPLGVAAGIASRTGRRAKASPPRRRRATVVKRKARVPKRKAAPKRRVRRTTARRRGIRRG